MIMRRSIAVAGAAAAFMVPGGEAQADSQTQQVSTPLTAGLGNVAAVAWEAPAQAAMSDDHRAFLINCLSMYSDIIEGQDRPATVSYRTPNRVRAVLDPTNDLKGEIAKFSPECAELAPQVERRSVLRISYGGKQIGAKEMLNPRTDDGSIRVENFRTKRPFRRIGSLVTRLVTTAKAQGVSFTETLRFK